jgi:hypothetical protein
MSEKETPQVQEQVPGQEVPDEANAEITLNDLASLKAIIDVASQRGAFKPNEMVAVGTLYNKLDKFLQLAQKNRAQG